MSTYRAVCLLTGQYVDKSVLEFVHCQVGTDEARGIRLDVGQSLNRHNKYTLKLKLLLLYNNTECIHNVLTIVSVSNPCKLLSFYE